MYVLRATDRPKNHAYVTPDGSHKSYGTKDKAKVYTSREAAEREACGNEVAEQIAGLSQ